MLESIPEKSLSEENDTSAYKTEEIDVSIILNKRIERFENDEFYPKVTLQFLHKLSSHFKAKLNQESTSFINSLHNLTVQHLGKAGKKDQREISDDERFDFFLYIRDYLWRKKMVAGTVYNMWWIEQFNAIDQMIDSTKVTIDVELMEKDSGTVDTSIGTSTTASSHKRFLLKGESKIYSYIWYTVIKNMADKNFYKTGDSTTNEKKFSDLIDNLIKNLYNSNKTPESQKDVIRKDKKLKYLIMQVIKEYGIFTLSQNNLVFNEGKIESFQKDISTLGIKMCNEFVKVLNRILDQQPTTSYKGTDENKF